MQNAIVTVAFSQNMRLDRSNRNRLFAARTPNPSGNNGPMRGRRPILAGILRRGYRLIKDRGLTRIAVAKLIGIEPPAIRPPSPAFLCCFTEISTSWSNAVSIRISRSTEYPRY